MNKKKTQHKKIDEKKSAIRKIVLVSVIAKKEDQSLREGDNVRFEISIKKWNLQLCSIQK